MALKQFTVVYPDGSKRNIGCAERDSLLLSRLIRKTTEPNKFIFAGERHTFHSLAELGQLRSTATVVNMKRFLAGSFVIEAEDGSKRSERLETPEGLIERLERKGMLVAA